jgi:hypothetical protein
MGVEITATEGEAVLDEDEETPLLEDNGKSCMFECVGIDCVDNRCCDAKPGDGKAAAYGAVGGNGK